MTRLKAASLHLLFSFLVVSLIAITTYFIWYPGPLFLAASGKDIMLILLVVDLCIGPLLTLVVFDIKKKSLRKDMLVVLLIQLSFIIYGIVVIFSARPVYFTFLNDRFHLVTANEIDEDDSKLATIDKFKSLPKLGPIPAAAVIPDNYAEIEKFSVAAFAGLGPQHFPELYTDLKNVKKSILDSAIQPPSSYTHNLNDEIHLWLPLKTKNGQLYLILSKENFEVIRVINLES